MFDIGFSELMLIGLVALIVIGPERLPKVARTVGHLLGRLQRYVSDVKSDIRREIQLDELRKLQGEMQDSARHLESSIRNEMSDVKQSIDQSAAEARASIADLEVQLEKARAAVPAPGPDEVQAGFERAAAAPSEGPAEPKPQLELGFDAAGAPQDRKPA